MENRRTPAPISPNYFWNNNKTYENSKNKRSPNGVKVKKKISFLPLLASLSIYTKRKEESKLCLVKVKLWG